MATFSGITRNTHFAASSTIGEIIIEVKLNVHFIHCDFEKRKAENKRSDFACLNTYRLRGAFDAFPLLRSFPLTLSPDFLFDALAGVLLFGIFGD